MPVALALLVESRGPSRRLDIRGVARELRPARRGVRDRPRAGALGWTSVGVLASIGGGIVLLGAFVAWELPRLRRCCRCGSSATEPSPPRTPSRWRCSSGPSARSSCWPSSSRPRRATHRSRPACTLPWTAMPIFVAPVAGILSDRIGSRPLMAGGLALPGARARLPRHHERSGRRLRHARARVRHGRHRDGGRVRPGRQRRAQLGASTERGASLGRYEHDPRGRRRAGRRGARHSLHRGGRLRLAPGLRGRSDPGGVVGSAALAVAAVVALPILGRRAAAEVHELGEAAPAEALAA